MTDRMLIDASHPEETRVVVLHGNRVEDFDFETASRKQLRGNIYLAKVVRIEPSLQAAFVEYGGGRHGFLPFTEIHPDYYQLPVADRERLIAEEEEAARLEETESPPAGPSPAEPDMADERDTATAEAPTDEGEAPASDDRPAADADGADGEADQTIDASTDGEPPRELETVGGDDAEENRRENYRSFRRYKIQEVIKRRQILLVQVVKEERGTKGAALTTYLSLAGRYCVLMPNAHRGGGISRKISNAADRKRLKSIISDLETPEGMAVIIRTAGMNRSRAELKRDHEYLLRLWENIRETTLTSTAPALVYEEANLIKRSIRDLYAREIEEILVEGEDGYRIAKDFMRMLMPSHAKRVQPYRDGTVPLLQRYQVEGQLDAIHNETVTLRSGGYIVINSTEALVAIDVNSGRSTRERNIEETAYRTNLEAADEVARQLRLRDLAGLIVVDFIDMEDQRNVRNVERRMKEAMKTDRARIQIGRISPFGLLELSRQRLRLSLLEISTERCPTCGGRGHVRSVESSAFHVLRAIEEEGMRRRSGEITVHLPTRVLLDLLNEKRQKLGAIEERYGFRVLVQTDDSLVPPAYRIERTRGRTAGEPAQASQAAESEAPPSPPAETREDGEPDTAARGERRGRRRRGRNGERREPRGGQQIAEQHAPDHTPDKVADAPDEAAAAPLAEDGAEQPEASAENGDEARRRRRRGRRGGRRRRRGDRPQQEMAADDGEDLEKEDLENEPATRPDEPQPAAVAHLEDDYLPTEPEEPRGIDSPWPVDTESAVIPEPHPEEPEENDGLAADHWPEDKSANAEPATMPPAQDDGKGERKRGWWQRVLS